MFQTLTQFIGFCCVLAAWWYDGQVHEYTYYIAVAGLVQYFYLLPGSTLDMLVYVVTGSTGAMGSWAPYFRKAEDEDGAATNRLTTLLSLLIPMPLVTWFYYSVFTDLWAMRGF